jgi:hypothetical protein
MMMLKIIVTTFIALNISSLVHAEEITKEDFVSAMKTALPAVFCKPEQYFRQCFDVSAIECEETAASTTRICLKELGSKIPSILNQPKDGSYWGTKLGECAGNAYSVVLSEKLLSNAKCNNVNNWN